MKRFPQGILIFLSLASCHQSALISEGTARLRVIATAGQEDLEFAAVLEGPAGQSLNGALMQLKDTSGAITSMSFNNIRNSYITHTALDSGNYLVSVDSNIAGKLQVTIPVTILQESPTIIDIQDGKGNSVAQFQRLSANTPLRVSWKKSTGADQYLLEIRQSGRVVASVTSNETEIIIQPGLLKGSSLPGLTTSVTVTASKIGGDSSFQTSNYLTVSNITSPGPLFQMVP